MSAAKGRVPREGVVSFGDASLSVWEESIPRSWGPEKDAWELAFKRQVFARVVQTLNRLGWTCTMPEISKNDVKHYGGKVARWSAEAKRDCCKGDLKGELHVSGRVIEFNMWQGVNTPTRPDHGGRYESNKEDCMPYLLRVEMERTRCRIRDYLLNVMTAYTFKPKDPECGPRGVTAIEYSGHRRRTSGHYVADLDRARISMERNALSGDKRVIEHGARVYALDWRTRRIVNGIALYDLNDRWTVVTGRYDYTVCSAHEIYLQAPPNLRQRRTEGERRKRLEQELKAAVARMDFKRAEVLKNVLFPTGPLYAIWSERNSAYFAINYCGYRNNLAEAGHYTRAELKCYLGDELEKKAEGLKAVLVREAA